MALSVSKNITQLIVTPNALWARVRSLRSASSSKNNNLFSRISPLGNPGSSIVPVLDAWLLEGRKVKKLELQRVIRDLRSRRRYTQALEVSEWMNSLQLEFSSADHAVQLDLTGRVRGLESAESYFSSLSEKDKIDKTYGALLNCYVQKGLVEKSLTHLQKMREMGFLSTLNYNDLMCLYTNIGEFEKVPDVLSEMKENAVFPDNFSYRICINSYGARSDFIGMEKFLAEMEGKVSLDVNWITYSMVANYYIKGGYNEKALYYLKKCEEKVGKEALGYNHLISLHGNLGNKGEIMRLWNLQKAQCKKQMNRDYITLLGSLVKIGELEEAEAILKEWESSCETYDFRVPNVLLIGYCQKGLTEKAEAKLTEIIVKSQKAATPNSWSIIAAGYMNKKNMPKAVECFENALAVEAENREWRPKPSMISGILDWLGDNGDVEQIEAFLTSLQKKVPKNREMYHALIKAYMRAGLDVQVLVERMRADEVHVDEETTQTLLR